MELLYTEKRVSGTGIIPRNGVRRTYYRIVGTFRCPRCLQIKEYKVSIGLKLKRCGCVPNGTTHGLRWDPVYTLWKKIKYRCYNPNYPEYHLYGGRGIKMCRAWKRSPVTFVAWARSHGWSPDLEIDRRNNSKGYSPTNCRFTTGAVNSQNSRQAKLSAWKVRLIRYRHAHHWTKRALATSFGVSFNTIRNVVLRRTWRNIT